MVGTLPSVDGTTHIRLADGAEALAAHMPVYDGVLQTPVRKLAVCTVPRDVVLELVVPTDWTRVRICARTRSTSSPAAR